MDATKLKVRDLMNTDVAKLDVGMPVDEAITMLEADRISGAPVVDAGGRVVGILSLTDVARAKEAEGGHPSSERDEYYLPDADLDEEGDFGTMGDYSPESLPSGTVAEWMSEDVVSVEPGDSVRVACKKMRDRRIHRVLVVEDGKLEGILSSFDVVRQIADHG